MCVLRRGRQGQPQGVDTAAGAGVEVGLEVRARAGANLMTSAFGVAPGSGCSKFHKHRKWGDHRRPPSFQLADIVPRVADLPPPFPPGHLRHGGQGLRGEGPQPVHTGDCPVPDTATPA